MTGKIKVRPALPLWQRLRRRWRAWRGAGLCKTHVVDLVQIGSARLKRVRFADPAQAQAVADSLEQFADSGCFPALLMRQGPQLWVDYVPGAPPRLEDAVARGRLVDFFVRLYTHRPALAADPGPAAGQLDRDLDFLNRCGVIESDRAADLMRQARALRPERVWSGLDYADPLAKNFILQTDRAVGIDIEALLPNASLGTGLAKAWLRWSFDPVPEVIEQVVSVGGPDLNEQWPWVRLCFLCEYFRQKVLQGKPGYIRVEMLDRVAG